MVQQLIDPTGSIQLAAQNAIPAEFTSAPDPFWTELQIDESRWDAVYPFQLILVKHVGSGQYQPVGNGTFTLPIPPSALQRSMPFAMVPDVTLGGIVEQDNGIPVRPITLQGTMGVVPGRGAGTQPQNGGFSIFAGTIAATSRLATNSPSSALTATVLTDDDISGDLAGTTGYYQFLLLQKFLEGYANLKKTAAGSAYRLAFAHWKRQEVFLVTPLVYDAQQTASSPHEITFNLAFKAWRRIDLNVSSQAISTALPIAKDPAKLQQLLANIDNCRQVLANASDVVQAVRSDVSTALYEPLRSVSLFVKDVLGVAISAADLPVNIVKDMKGAILEALSTNQTAQGTAGFLGTLPQRLSAGLQDAKTTLQQFSVSTGKAEVGSGDNYQGLPGIGSADPDPANKLLENPADNYDLFAAIKPGDLNLPPNVTKKILAERQRVRQFTRLNFETMRDTLVSLAADFADGVGAGDASYNKLNGRPVPSSTRTPTADDFDVIFNLNQSILEMNRLAASTTINPDQTTAIDYIAGLATRSGIEFTVPNSKRMVPFPYGSTLEKLSARYLGDPDRWMEIATLNRLRDPYVDEEGFNLPLLVNGSGNIVAVGDASHLFVGQPVWLSSGSASRTKRRITKIDPISTNVFNVTVDGDPTLNAYTTLAGANLHAFLPDTVNSQMLIAIPDDGQPNEVDYGGKSIPGLDLYNTWLQIGGVDLMLTQSGDAAITPDGDWKLAIGMQNLVQRVYTFVRTRKGSLIRHPTYGIAVKPGDSTADITAKELLASIKSLFTFDPVFTSVHGATVQKQGPAAKLSMSLGVIGTQTLLPISLDVLG